MYTQLRLDADCTQNGIPALAHLHLAMCYLTGFGTSVSPHRFLENLIQGALCEDP